MGLLSKFIRVGRPATPAPTAAALPPAGAGFAVVDIETTGLGPSCERIIELGIVCLSPDGETVGEWLSRFNPQQPVGATHIHGVTDRDVARAPLFAERMEEIVCCLRGRVLVAHNVLFDLAFLSAEFERAGWLLPQVPAFCTLKTSRFYLPDLAGRRLPDCCAAVGVRLARSHAALSDAHATAALLCSYLDPALPPPPLREHLALVQRAAAVEWPLGPLPPGERRMFRPAVTAISGIERAGEWGGDGQPSVGPPTERSPGGQLSVGQPRIELAGSLLATLADYSLEAALEEGAPEGALSYLQLVLEVLEDGEISVDEGFALAELAVAYGLTTEDRAAAHRGFLVALAQKALADGHVSAAEREELVLVARLLDLPEAVVAAALSDAEQQRTRELGHEPQPLPAGWALGEPLRVGDSVVFTGCEAYGRRELEQRATQAGLRVTSSVSRRTAALVSDATMFGNKTLAASQHSTRIIHPGDLDAFLAHLQPALPPAAARARKSPAGAGVGSGNAVEVETSSSTHLPSPGEDTGEIDPAAVRAWARASGIAVGSRGRLHQDVIDAYWLAKTLGPAPDSASSDHNGE